MAHMGASHYMPVRFAKVRFTLKKALILQMQDSEVVARSRGFPEGNWEGLFGWGYTSIARIRGLSF